MKSFATKISAFSIALFGTFGLFPNDNKELLFIVLSAAAVLSVIAFKQVKFHKLIVINSILIINYLVALTYTSDIGAAVKRFETGASIIVAPIVFSLFYFNQKSIFSDKVKQLFFKFLHWSNVVFSIIIILFYLKLKYIDSKGDYGYFLSHLERKLPLLSDHPIYISLILAVPILFTLNYILSEKMSRSFNLIYGITSLLLVLVIIFLSRKGIVLGLFISILFIILFYFQKSIVKIVSSFLLVLIVFVGLLFIIPQTNQRVKEVLKKASYGSENETNSTNNRIHIYKCAFYLIKEKPIFGYGIEDDRKALNQCYKENLYYLFEYKFNTHNQYLSILMKTGIVGLFLFLGFLYYNINLALRARDWLFSGIIIFFIVIMMFENILERQNGVMIFTFLINYFAFKSLVLLTDSKS